MQKIQSKCVRVHVEYARVHPYERLTKIPVAQKLASAMPNIYKSAGLVAVQKELQIASLLRHSQPLLSEPASQRSTYIHT